MKQFVLMGIAMFIVCQNLYSQADVLMQHHDNERTGWNNQETKLNISNVKAGNFGKLFADSVDDEVYAQPLVVTGVNIPSVGIRNVVYVATENNTLYAFDADSLRSAGPYWQRNLTPAGSRTALNSDYTGAVLCGGNYTDFAGKIGIVGTPIIDKSAGTIYLVAKSVNTSSGKVFSQWLHAINIADGTERAGSPVQITASISGSGMGSSGGILTFDAMTENQRSGLLLLNGIVFIDYSGHCDMDPYHCWLFGYDEVTLQQKYVYCATPDGSGGGSWMAGNGPAADAAGNIYLATGNGFTDPTNNRRRSSSLLKLFPSGGTVTEADFFIPSNYSTLDNNDLDFGPCATMLIPGLNRVLTGAKDGNLYLCDINNLGGFNANSNNVVQNINLGTAAHLRASFGYYGGTANHYVYSWSENTALKQWPVNQAAGNFNLAGEISSGLQGPVGNSGACMATSSNGSVDSSAILWVAHANGCDANHQVCPGIVRAINANDVTKELWNTTLSPADNIGNFAKFSTPAIANGKVYVASFSNSISVYGLLNSSGIDTCTSPNIALNQPATASSLENPGFPASNAFDGNLTTRWSSSFSDANWIYVDLGKRYDLCKVVINWENAYATNFDIQVSDDATNWTTVYPARGNISLLSIMPVQGSGRYVRMNGINRATQYGYSIFEMQVYGTLSVTCPAPTGLAASNIQQNTATLGWNAVAGATGYNVQYKAASDASWTVTSSATNSLPVSALSCATDYLFQVAANCASGGTSAFAAGAFTTAACSGGCGPLPTRWTTSNIGNPGQAGEACSDGTTFTLQGSGADIGGTSDQFRYAYLSLTGDDQFVTRVVTLTGGNTGDKAGIMIRQDITPNAPNAFIALSTGVGAIFQQRSTVGGNTTAVTSPGIVPPYWIKLNKSGSVYTASISPDGLVWSVLGSPVDLGFGAGGSQAFAGLAITSDNNATISTSTMDNFTAGLPLPIQLISFTARSSGQTVILQWATAQEQNADYFVVERSRDGINYGPVATVKAVGSSNTREDYTATDENPGRGINYYRLRSVDLDGKQSYSPVAIVRSGDGLAPMLFPNPANSYFRIAAGSASIREVNVYEVTGRRALTMPNGAGASILYVPCGHLGQGVYFVEIRTETGRYVQRLVKN